LAASAIEADCEPLQHRSSRRTAAHLSGAGLRIAVGSHLFSGRREQRLGFRLLSLR